MATRYSSFDSRSSGSSSSTPSSSTDLRMARKSSLPSTAIVKVKPGDVVTKNGQNFGSMVRKFMERKTKPKAAERMVLPVPADPIARDGRKAVEKGSNLSALHKKLFQKGGSADRTGTKALTEVKSNTRTLAMVLRSERDLIAKNKEYEAEILELRLALEEKNREMDKLKDLCLKQREEIKAFKDAILFPDVMNAQLQVLLDRQGSELKEAKRVIPALQKQVSSLTGQLQCLAEDLAEVKADKYLGKSSDGPFNSPRTPMHERGSVNSLDFSSTDQLASASPDDMYLRDLNPCLTSCFSKSKSKEFNRFMTSDSP